VETHKAPHIENYRGSDYEHRTTYRRDARLKAVKNGPERHFGRDGQLWHEANFYEGQLHGPRMLNDAKLSVRLEGMYRNGVAHGPFRGGDGETWIWQGEFAAGEYHGTWTVLHPRQRARWLPPSFEDYCLSDGSPKGLPDHQEIVLRDPVRLTANWQHGRRQGAWTWATLDGEVLNTAEYADDQLVRWNGEPVVQQFREWLVGPEVNDPELADALFAKQAGPLARGSGIFDGDLVLTIHLAGQSEVPLVIHSQPSLTLALCAGLRDTPQAAAAICERAIMNGQRFEYRYGALWFVPNADPEPPFVDRTGVEKIKFPPGSPQQRDWEAVIDVEDQRGRTAECVRAVLGDSSIRYDVSKLKGPFLNGTSIRSGPTGSSLISFRRSRRDLLGLILYRTSCHCELRQGVLHFLPDDNQREDERNVQPLLRPHG
jgi:hypothetical protein